jgi:hypothetical protein
MTGKFYFPRRVEPCRRYRDSPWAKANIGGTALFGVIALRDAEIALEREPLRRRDT